MKDHILLIVKFISSSNLRKSRYEEILEHCIESCRFCICKFNFPKSVNQNCYNSVISSNTPNTLEITSIFKITFVNNNGIKIYL